jgi:hypothetical protein
MLGGPQCWSGLVLRRKNTCSCWEPNCFCPSHSFFTNDWAILASLNYEGIIKWKQRLILVTAKLFKYHCGSKGYPVMKHMGCGSLWHCTTVPGHNTFHRMVMNFALWICILIDKACHGTDCYSCIRKSISYLGTLFSMHISYSLKENKPTCCMCLHCQATNTH